MAKKETKAAATTPANPTSETAAPKGPTAQELAKKAREEKKARQEKDRFIRVIAPDGKPAAPSKKIAPQALAICNIIEAAGEAGLSRTELVEKMKGVVQTRQPESRILSYYQQEIQDVGCVKKIEAVA